MISVPEDAIDFVRTVFERCNHAVTAQIANQPNAPEQALDFQLIASLAHYASPVRLSSGTVVVIDTHYLGGLRHYGLWEIADVGLFVFVRQAGMLMMRKVALLQSKRLYPSNKDVRSEEFYDYVLGMGRIAHVEEKILPLSQRKKFFFTEECTYGALTAASKQVEAIERFTSERRIPVYYSFYNPPVLPFRRMIPSSGWEDQRDRPVLGCRVAPFADVHGLLASQGNGSSPSIREMHFRTTYVAGDSQSHRGWRLEYFVSDLVLRCREGYVFESFEDEGIQSLFYRRTGPIAAAIVVTIDLQ